MGNCKEWLLDNKLSLHVGKTESILFGTPRNLKHAIDFRVTCDGQLVKRVTSVKYLGLQLDENLTGSIHALEIIKKCAGRIAFLYRHAEVLSLHCRKLLCSALIVPMLDYCCSSWYSGLTVKLKSRLDVLQRRMIRFICSLEPRSHIGTEKLRELSWLSLKDRVKYFKLQHVFKIRLGLAPDYLGQRFEPIAATHSHNTRGSSYNYRISRDLAQSRSGFAFTSIKEWNDLPMDVKKCSSLISFRTKLKEHLMSCYWYSYLTYLDPGFRLWS